MTKTHHMCAYRMRNFLQRLIIKMKENPEDWKKIVDDAVKCALRLWGIKRLINATWNELALSCFWLVMLQNKITKYKLTYLVDLAKDVLGKRVRSSRIIKITTFLRRLLNMYDTKKEAKQLIEMMIMKLDKKLCASREYINELKTVAVAIVDMVGGKISMSPRMLAACSLYLADKKVCKKLGIKPMLTAKSLAEITGLSLYSILKKTTLIFDYIKDIDSDAHE